jgi:hypothetical protein
LFSDLKLISIGQSLLGEKYVVEKRKKKKKSSGHFVKLGPTFIILLVLKKAV